MKLIKLLPILLLSTFSIFGQVSTDVQKRNAVLIDNTGIYCSACGFAALNIEEVLISNPNLVVIANHGGCYSDPGSPYDVELRTEQTVEYDDNIAFYDNSIISAITGYPTITIDGNRVGYFTENLTNAINLVQQEDSYVNIYASAIIDTLSRELTVEVECYYTGNSPNENFLNVAILQDGIFGYQSGQPGSITGNFTFDHALRHLLTSTWGESIGTPQQGEYVYKTYTYNIPENYSYTGTPFESNLVNIVFSNLKIAAYVSHVEDVMSGAYKYQEIETGSFANLTLVGSNTVDEILSNSFIEIVPNPISAGSENINLKSDKSFRCKRISLHDLNGKEVFRCRDFRITQGMNKLQTSSCLRKGEYILSLVSEEKTLTKKIIII